MSSDKRWMKVSAVLGATTIAALLASFGTTRVVARYLILPDDASLTEVDGASTDDADARQAPEQNTTRRPRKKSRSAWLDPIMERSIFDSTKVGSTGTSRPSNPDDLPQADLKVVLLGTVVAEPMEYSSALIAEERGKGWATGYSIGDDLMGTTVLRIEQKRVIICLDGTVEWSDDEATFVCRGGTEQYIGMDEDESTTASRSSSADAGEEGVTSTGENEFVVDASLVEQALENPDQLASQIRVVPHKGADGEIDGYRLSGIRRNSLFYKLGIKNGDIIHDVNGLALTSTSGALDAYNSLQSERNFTFELTRRNKKQTFKYEIR